MLPNINSVKFLNEGQTIIGACDQPLFTLSMEAKYCLMFNDYVVLFATLHIEESFYGIHADLINGIRFAPDHESS